MRGEYVEEFEGSYGPIVISERLLQRFWHRRATQLRGLHTTAGLPLHIHVAGDWNFREGPDFLRAQMSLAGKRVTGDVEIHFHANDWFAHGHHDDPHYANVQLHVTLSPHQVTRCAEGYYPPHQLILMECLPSDLEQLLETDYREQWIYPPARTHNPDRWSTLTIEQRRTELIQRAHCRLLQKTRALSVSLQRALMDEVCHQRTLEILGYPHNRLPMLQIARQFPLDVLGQHSAQSLWNAVTGWNTQGVRPNAHPWPRLYQYWQYVQQHPDWPSRIRSLAHTLPDFRTEPSFTEPAAISQWRRHRLYPWIRNVERVLAWERFSRGVSQNLWINLLWPLLAIESPDQVWPLWFTMPVGLHPDSYRQWLKSWEICPLPSYPLCNGWLQGTIHLFQHQNKQG